MEASVTRSWNVVGCARQSPGALEPLASLMAGYQSGDAPSFRRFHAALRPSLAAYLVSLGADAAALDSLLDEVFLQIHGARRTWSPGWPVEPWVRDIACHVYRTSRLISRARTSTR